MNQIPSRHPEKQGIVFTALLIYLWLCMVPFPLTEMPVSSRFLDAYQWFMDFLNRGFSWIFWNATDLHSQIQTRGSGDARYNYAMLATMTSLALILSAILHFSIRKTEFFTRFYKLTIVYCRYFVGLYLLLYGFSKFHESQFLLPRLMDLERKTGDLSPMDLLWFFMGYSPLYCAFTGLGEIFGGLCLLFRKTKALGCIVAIAAMSNVFMLNLSYDVPVKLFSFHLVMISVFILLPDLKGLFGLFFRQEPYRLQGEPMVLPENWMRRGRIFLKTFLILGAPANILLGGYLFPEKKDTTLEGSYPVQYTICNQDTLAIRSRQPASWNRLILENRMARIFLHDGTVLDFKSLIDTNQHTLNLDSLRKEQASLRFHYSVPLPEELILSGKIGTDSIRMHCTKTGIQDYPLIRRGFHWINEYPYYSIY